MQKHAVCSIMGDSLPIPFQCVYIDHLIYGRLRAKIRTPYQTLCGHVAKLERLQQASDLLRRTSRFVVLTRRLQTQLAEMDRVGDTTPSAVDSKILPVGSKSSELANDSTRRSTDSVSTLTGVGTSTDDDEKEKVIAKAALSIAELGMLDLY